MQKAIIGVSAMGKSTRLTRLADRLLGFSWCNQFLAEAEERKFDVAQFGVHYCEYCALHPTFSKPLAEVIPASGPCIVVCNHPTGLAETGVMLQAVYACRPDMKVIANELLGKIASVQEVLLPVQVLPGKERRSHVDALRLALKHLEEGGVLLVFPAGAISVYDPQIKDSWDKPWQSSFVWLAQKANCRIVPVYADFKAHPLFYRAARFSQTIRVGWNARNLLALARKPMPFTVGSAISLKAFPELGKEALAGLIKSYTYALASASKGFSLEAPLQAQLATPPSASAAFAELAGRVPLFENAQYVAYLTEAKQTPLLLELLGVEREKAFRGAHIGSGKPSLLDDFDAHTKHLSLWTKGQQALVGGYRMGFVKGSLGLSHSYLSRDHNYSEAISDGCMELSRAFVVANFQTSTGALISLLRSLGAAISAHPGHRFVVGELTLPSLLYPKQALAIIASYVYRQAEAPCILLSPKKRYQPGPLSVHIEACIEKLRSFADLEKLLVHLGYPKIGVSPLLRAYEACGAKVVGCSINHDLSDAFGLSMQWDLSQEIPEGTKLFWGTIPQFQIS